MRLNHPGMGANECVEESLDHFASELETALDTDVLAFDGPLLYGTDDLVRAILEARNTRRDHLAVVLETDGGFMEPVRRIVEVMRHHYAEVEFIVPSHAFSAGTVLVMSGDAIHMDYYSNLGPIDPQVQNKDGKSVPALGYLMQYNRLLDLARKGQATTTDMTILLSFDQAELYAYEQERELSIAFLKEWLAKYKFKNWTKTATRGVTVTKAMKERRAEQIAQALNETDRWHAHGTGISMEVLRRELNLIIEDFGQDEELSEKIRTYHGLVESYRAVRRQNILLHSVDGLLFA